MSYQPRGISRKRHHSATSSEAAVRPSASTPPPPASNRLLAGYMAYEFLEKGTLFGHTFEDEGAADSKRSRKRQQASREGEDLGLAEPNYFEVANLVKSEGVHVAGVVNPTQLARWIHQT